MNFVRISLLGLLSLPMLSAAQTTRPAVYDVSTVKPHDPRSVHMRWQADESGVRIMDALIKYIIASGWEMRPDQVTGEPAWVDNLHWDITGKSTELSPEQLKKLTPEQRNEMMQQLLAQRFHLKSHLETRTGPVFTLVPAKSGIKLHPIPMTAEEKLSRRIPGSSFSVRGGEAEVMEAKKVSLDMLIRNLAANTQRTVIDRTGLPSDGLYDFTLRWAPDYGMSPSKDGDAPSMSAALEEQLGIHLEASKGPVQVLVIDHVEKPTDN